MYNVIMIVPIILVFADLLMTPVNGTQLDQRSVSAYDIYGHIENNTKWKNADDNQTDLFNVYSVFNMNNTVVIEVPAYLTIYVTVANIAIFVIGVVGNCLVILAVVVFRDMRTPMNWYLVNLSVADLLILSICQPAALTEFYAMDRWILGESLCKYYALLLFMRNRQ